MSTYLNYFYFKGRGRWLIPRNCNNSFYNVKRMSRSDLILFFNKLASILMFSGKKGKIFSILKKVFLLLEVKFNCSIFEIFELILRKYIVFIGIRMNRRAGTPIKDLCLLDLDRAYGLFGRWVKSALLSRKERSLVEKMFIEFSGVYEGEGGFILLERERYLQKISEIRGKLYA